ncbi:MAG: trypsin-like peptidase domain-containing protein [Alphaproteobacteria bacterium]|nr:trypsin-like peptidase domain-containing protein [Alphaproteobacteria bacterium]
MSLSKKIAAPLAVSFGLMAGSASVQADAATVANDNNANTMSFSCDMPDLSGMAWPDKLERLMPANVFIETSTTVKPKDGEAGASKRKEKTKKKKPEIQRSTGSGFIVDPRGYIFTNHHVAGMADKIEITLFDDSKRNDLGEKVTATRVGTDAELDLAVLKVDVDEDLTCVNLGNSTSIRRGEVVGAVGNPFGQSFSFSQGVISFPDRSLSGLFDFVQTDAAINRGNSGGALYNEAGEVIAMNTAIFSPTGGSVGIGFSTRSNDIRKVANQLMQHGEIRRGALGVGIGDVTKEVAERMKVREGVGVLVSGVKPKGPAALGGVKKDDIILEVNGQAVSATWELQRKIASYKPKEKIKLKVLRDHKVELLHVVLGERKATLKAMAAPKIPDEFMPESPAPMPKQQKQPQKKPSKPSFPWLPW